MAKARKAPVKKAQKPGNRNIKIASALAVALGALVALSMIIGSVFTQNPQVAVPQPTDVPTVIVPTTAP